MKSSICFSIVSYIAGFLLLFAKSSLVFSQVPSSQPHDSVPIPRHLFSHLYQKTELRVYEGQKGEKHYIYEPLALFQSDSLGNIKVDRDEKVVTLYLVLYDSFLIEQINEEIFRLYRKKLTGKLSLLQLSMLKIKPRNKTYNHIDGYVQQSDSVIRFDSTEFPITFECPTVDDAKKFEMALKTRNIVFDLTYGLWAQVSQQATLKITWKNVREIVNKNLLKPGSQAPSLGPQEPIFLNQSQAARIINEVIKKRLIEQIVDPGMESFIKDVADIQKQFWKDVTKEEEYNIVDLKKYTKLYIGNESFTPDKIEQEHIKIANTLSSEIKRIFKIYEEAARNSKSDVERYRKSIEDQERETSISSKVGVAVVNVDASLSRKTKDKMEKEMKNRDFKEFSRQTKDEFFSDILQKVNKSTNREYSWKGTKIIPKKIRLHRLLTEKLNRDEVFYHKIIKIVKYYKTESRVRGTKSHLYTQPICNRYREQCDKNGAVVVCNPQGTQWIIREKCNQPKICINPCSGNQPCQGGVECQQVICNPNEKRCDNNRTKICNSHGTKWIYLQDPCEICKPNEKRCDHSKNALMVCNKHRNKWELYQQCAYQEKCNNFRCEECTLNQRECHGSGYRICGDHGKWLYHSCSARETCSNGYCISPPPPPECTFPQRECHRSGYKECDKNGKWVYHSSCPSSQTCINGNCVDACVSKKVSLFVKARAREKHYDITTQWFRVPSGCELDTSINVTNHWRAKNVPLGFHVRRINTNGGAHPNGDCSYVNILYSRRMGYRIIAYAGCVTQHYVGPIVWWGHGNWTEAFIDVYLRQK